MWGGLAITIVIIFDLAIAISKSDTSTAAYHFIYVNCLLIWFAMLIQVDQCSIGLYGGHSRILSEQHLGMQYISTRFIHCKYSLHATCYILPPVLSVLVSASLLQVHYTWCLTRSLPDGSRHVDSFLKYVALGDLLCYAAVLGFLAVMLFDSHAVSGHKYASRVHVSGVVILTVCVLLMHIQCWLSLTAFCSTNKVQNAVQDLKAYEFMEVVYGIFLVVFVILFVVQAPFAIQFEYCVMACFMILSVANLLTQFRILEIQSQSTSLNGQKINNKTSINALGFDSMRIIGASHDNYDNYEDHNDYNAHAVDIGSKVQTDFFILAGVLTIPSVTMLYLSLL